MPSCRSTTLCNSQFHINIHINTVHDGRLYLRAVITSFQSILAKGRIAAVQPVSWKTPTLPAALGTLDVIPSKVPILTEGGSRPVLHNSPVYPTQAHRTKKHRQTERHADSALFIGLRYMHGTGRYKGRLKRSTADAEGPRDAP